MRGADVNAEAMVAGGEAKWSEVLDPSSGMYYYYNSETGACEWEMPPDFDGVSVAPAPAAVPAAPAAASTKGKTVIIHGQAHDVDENLKQAEEEERLWKLEKGQIKAKDVLETAIAKIFENGGGQDGLESWTVHDYNKVMDALALGRECCMDDPRHEVTKAVKGHSVLMEARQFALQFEEMEGRRRAEAKIAKRKEEKELLAKEVKDGEADLAKQDKRLRELKEMAYSGAELDPELNGLYMDHPEVKKRAVGANDALITAGVRRGELPKRERDLKMNMVRNFTKAVRVAIQQVTMVDSTISSEKSRRDKVERTLRMEKELKAKQEREAREAAEKARREKEEAARLKALAAEDARLAAEEKKRIAAEAKAQELAEARAKVVAELDAMKANRAEEAAKVAAESEAWALRTFASQEEADKARADKEKNDALRARLQREQDERDEARRLELEAEQAAANAELAAQQAAIAAAEAEKKRVEDEIKWKKEYEEAKYQTEKLKRDEERRKKKAAEMSRLLAIEEARAAVDEGADDDEKERQAREDAKEHIDDYQPTPDPFTGVCPKKGTAFTAAKENNVEMMRNFFLVKGSKFLLNDRDHSREGGGRTLLQVAAWYGCVEAMRFLLGLGAEVNTIDTGYSRCTPLMDACRSGRFVIVKMLLDHGADVKAQDSHGDTCMHWGARRGWGSMLRNVLKHAERVKPGSTKGLLLVRNAKNKTCKDVAKNETVAQLIQQQMNQYGERDKKHAGLMARMRKGLGKAKVLGMNIGGDALRTVKAQRRRYGKVRKKRKKREKLYDKKGKKKGGKETKIEELDPSKVTAKMRSQMSAAELAKLKAREEAMAAAEAAKKSTMAVGEDLGLASLGIDLGGFSYGAR